MEITRTRPLDLNPAHSISTRVQDLMVRLTVDEKIAQMTSVWFKDLQAKALQVDRESSSAEDANHVGRWNRPGHACRRIKHLIANRGPPAVEMSFSDSAE